MILGVFVPSLMGAGILVSGAILLVDVLRRYLPQSGLHRRHRVAMGTYNVVVAAAAWAGREVSAGELLDRAPRSRTAYVAWATAFASLAVAIPVAMAAAYRDELGLFYASPWMVGLGAAWGIIVGLLALFLLIIAVLARRPPRPIRWLIATTALGRFQVPDPLPFEGP